jgi:hypothetical protein
MPGLQPARPEVGGSVAHDPALVETLGAADRDDAVTTLATAFHDYPVMRYVLGRERPDSPGKGVRSATHAPLDNLG